MLACELVVLLSEVWVTAFSAAGLLRVVCLVLCVAFSADVDILEYSVFGLIKSLCHCFNSPNKKVFDCKILSSWDRFLLYYGTGGGLLHHAVHIARKPSYRQFDDILCRIPCTFRPSNTSMPLVSEQNWGRRLSLHILYSCNRPYSLLLYGPDLFTR